MPLRIFVIGAGPAATDLHLPILARLRDHGDVELTLVCDLQPERAALARSRFGFQEAGGDALAALKREDIDAVYIFGSAQMHHTLGLAAIRNRKHLFVEKPIAPSYAAAREIAEMAREYGVMAVGGHNRRFYKAFEYLRAHTGKAGWSYAEAVFHKAESGRQVPFGAGSWLTANGIHALDALIDVMGGLPEEIFAMAGEGESAGSFSAAMRWRGGAQGVFLCNNKAGARREEYAFHAPGLTCHITEAGLAVETRGVVQNTKAPLTGDGLEGEHRAFLTAIRDNSQPRHAIAAIAPSLFVAELIEAGFSGPVRLPERKISTVPRAAPQAILVVEAAPLLPTLTRLLPHHRLVSPSDIGDVARPDIHAALIGGGGHPLPASLLMKLPNLEIVGIMGLSMTRYEPEVLLARGVRLVNASQAYAESVAEFALGLAILGRRRAFLSHETMRLGGWGITPPSKGFKGFILRLARALRPHLRKAGLEPMALRAWRKAVPSAASRGPDGPGELRGASAGLIGWGSNAQDFTRRLIAAGVHVSVYSEHAAIEDIQAAGAHSVSLADALAADIVSLHRGLTQNTRHTLGAPELARLRPGAVLINVARGALIDPAALLDRLKRGDIFACLDTFEIEPLSKSDPLRRLPNVFLSSHIAGGSRNMQERAAEEVVKAVAAHFKDQPISTISMSRLETMT